MNEASVLKNSHLEQDILLAEQAGFAYIELWLCQIDAYLENHSLEELASLFDGRRIKPYALDSFEDILFSDNFAALEKRFIQACEYGKCLRARNIVMVPTVRSGIHEQYSKAEIDAEAVKVLTYLAGIGESYGMRLAFEPIGFADCAVRSMEHAYEIIQKVNLDNVGLTLDIFNEYLYQGLADIAYIRKLDAKKVFILHVDDAPVLPLDQYRGDHSDRVCPGDGGLPCQEFVKLVREIGFDEEASIELFNEAIYAMSPEDAIHKCYESVKTLLEQTGSR